MATSSDVSHISTLKYQSCNRRYTIIRTCHVSGGKEGLTSSSSSSRSNFEFSIVFEEILLIDAGLDVSCPELSDILGDNFDNFLADDISQQQIIQTRAFIEDPAN